LVSIIIRAKAEVDVVDEAEVAVVVVAVERESQCHRLIWMPSWINSSAPLPEMTNELGLTLRSILMGTCLVVSLSL
jgi:hypothetical protein